MHHAAMANKREMMLTLARLGCDYRAKADGIDGATATFVLCGQHGKTTQQQVSSCNHCPDVRSLASRVKSLHEKALLKLVVPADCG